MYKEMYERINWLGVYFKENSKSVSTYKQLKRDYNDVCSRMQEVRYLARKMRDLGIMTSEECDKISVHVDYVFQEVHNWFLATEVIELN